MNSCTGDAHNRSYPPQPAGQSTDSIPQQIRGRLSILGDMLETQIMRLSRINDHLLGSVPREVAPSSGVLGAAQVHPSIFGQIEQLDVQMHRLISEIDRIA